MKPALSFSRWLSSAHLSLNLLGHFQLLWGFKKQSRSDSVSLLCNCIACPRSLAYHLLACIALTKRWDCKWSLENFEGDDMLHGFKFSHSPMLNVYELSYHSCSSHFRKPKSLTSEIFITLFPLVCSFTVSYSMWLLWRKKHLCSLQRFREHCYSF